MLKYIASLPAVLLVAACVPAVQPAPAPAPLPVATAATGYDNASPPLPTPIPVEGISGLEERQPDVCKAEQFVPYLGQPGSVIASLGITRPYRIVEYRGIEEQQYDPQRVVFRLDAAGNIYNIDCG